MKNEQRRSQILIKLQESSSPISATRLAEAFGVTRQIIVADIALLRAAGQQIRAEHYGYVLEKAQNDGIIKRIAVKHGRERLRDELYAIVDNGGKAIDVIVEHSVYGRICADLNLSSRYEVDEFVKKVTETEAAPLSQLTEGLHLHTISVKDEGAFERIVNALNKMEILVEYD